MSPTKRRQREIDARRLRQQALLQRKAAHMTKAQALANIESVPKPKHKSVVPPSIEEDAERWYSQLIQPSSSMWILPSQNLIFGSGSFSFGTRSLDLDKLEKLKAATPYKPVPQIRVPDLIECITGWRGWGLSKSGRLEALGQNTAWPVKEALTAVCENSGGHVAPNWSCSCGIWAFKDVDNLAASIGQYAVKVIGTVSLWGKVIETENGYRAEKAYPKELWLLDDSLEELGIIYDVPVRMIQPSTRG